MSPTLAWNCRRMNVNSLVPALPTTVPTARHDWRALGSCEVAVTGVLIRVSHAPRTQQPFAFRPAEESAECVEKLGVSFVKRSLQGLNGGVRVDGLAHPIRDMRELVHDIETDGEGVSRQEQRAVQHDCGDLLESLAVLVKE